MDQPLDLKTFEVIYVKADNLGDEAGIGKSLNVHRFMRHARECHKNLLEFLFQNNLLHGVGGSSLIAAERKTLIECSADIAQRIAALSFVETAAESAEVLPQRAADRRRTLAAGRI